MTMQNFFWMVVLMWVFDTLGAGLHLWMHHMPEALP